MVFQDLQDKRVNQALQALVAQAHLVSPVHQGLKETLVFRVLPVVLDFLVQRVMQDLLGCLAQVVLQDHLGLQACLCRDLKVSKAHLVPPEDLVLLALRVPVDFQAVEE